MEIKIVKTPLEEVQALRALFLQESNFQFVYNKCHDFGWADTYLFLQGEQKIGYGSVWGKDKRQDRDAIFEFYLLPFCRKQADLVFAAFRAACNATYIESQTNDELLTAMLYAHCQDINAEAILFKDHTTTHLNIPGAVFRKKMPEDKTEDADSEYVLELNSEIAATGGFVRSYNLPYIDMYYAVQTHLRRRGLGSLMTQELKKEAYSMQRVPAARCNINNTASKATLLKAGLRVCGFIVTGRLREKN